MVTHIKEYYAVSKTDTLALYSRGVNFKNTMLAKEIRQNIYIILLL